MLPPEIEYLLENYDSDDTTLLISKADFSGANPVLSVTINNSGSRIQNWILEIVGHRASELLFTSIVDDTTILLVDDHPLLWQYADFQSELYFNGTGADVYRVISELNRIDLELFGKYRHSGGQAFMLLRASHGLIAKGSRNLLTRYAECLNRHGIKTSMIGGYIPTYSDGKNEYTGETLKIFLLGSSYVVGQQFIFTKQDG